MTIEPNTDLSLTLQNLGRHAESEPYFVTTLELKRDAYGKDSLESAMIEAQLGICLLLQKKWAQAENDAPNCARDP